MYLYADIPPRAVYPDTFHGRETRNREFAGTKTRISHTFCDEYKPDEGGASLLIDAFGNFCANFNPYGDKAHNLCFRCPAGGRLWTRD